MNISTKKCLICKDGRKNDCLHWHIDTETNDIWVWCQGKCQRGYSIYQYVRQAGLSLKEFLKQDFDFRESKPDEVNQLTWPSSFVSLMDPRAKDGIEYIRSRGVSPTEYMFYDTWRKGIVFPYYFDNIFCGAQIRLIETWVDDNGDERKIDTMPGTRLGLLFYGWNQTPLMPHVKAVIVCEGAFNAIAIQQSLDKIYGGPIRNPWKTVACSGSGVSQHHATALKELKDNGYKVVAAPDSDEAGMKMLQKLIKNEAITHYSVTGDSDIDWNDMYKDLGPDKFNKTFLGGMKRV